MGCAVDVELDAHSHGSSLTASGKNVWPRQDLLRLGLRYLDLRFGDFPQLQRHVSPDETGASHPPADCPETPSGAPE